MVTSTGELLVRWTARLAVSCYLGRVLLDLGGARDPAAQRAAKWVWTVGAVIFVAHVLSAFHFVHGWSHASALEHTRRETQRMTGWDSGAGLYLNELMTALWVGDALLWWLWRDWPQQRWAYRCLQGYFAFMTFHATVVFGPRGWIVVAALLAAVGVLYGARNRKGGVSSKSLAK